MSAIAQLAPASPAPIPLLTRGSETKSAPINWVWPGRIARAKLTLFAGAPGSGKTALAASIAATVTTGGAYPCREGRAPQGAVLLVCPDGDPDVLIPRLRAAGADLGRVQLMRHVEGAKGARRFDLATDLAVLAQAARSIKDLSLIVIDGLYLPTGRNAARAIQALLDPLAALADVHKIAVTAMLTPPIKGCSPSASRPANSTTARARRGSNSKLSIIRSVRANSRRGKCAVSTPRPPTPSSF